MARLYMKRGRLLLLFCGIACVIVWSLINNQDDAQPNAMLNYAHLSKRLFIPDKDTTLDILQENPRTQGYSIAKRLRERCLTIDNSTYSSTLVRLNMMYQSTSGDLHLCPIWKAGSTFIKRLFLISNNREKYVNVSTPFDISFRVSYDPIDGLVSNLPVTRRVLFVRNPFKRLLSGYIDKVFAPNPVYWRIIGTRAIKLIRRDPDALSLKCGHDLTFAEYIKYIIIAMTPGNTFRATPDIHFQQITKLCKPCHVKYDFLGKIETFQTDVFELMDQLNMSETKTRLQYNMKELTADDAIRDTLSQPFDDVFREGYKRCVNFTEALKRAWTKLQMRGLIGRQELDLPNNFTENISRYQLIDLAREARRKSSLNERRALKKEYFERFFTSVELQDLKRIREIYSDDFELFEYNYKPEYIYSTRKHS